MKRKHIAPPINPQRTACITLPGGRLIQHGEEITVKGEGRFTFHYGWKGDEATCFGPIASKSPMWRTFRASRITIHKRTRKVTP